MLKKFLTVGGLLIFFSGAMFVFSCYSLGVPGLYRIANEGVPVEGRVIEKQPENRNNVKYAYEVGGRAYDGTGGPGDRFEAMQPGDSIAVYYDPKDPGFSLLGTSSFHELFAQTLLMSAVFSVITGSLFTLGFLGFGPRRLFR